MQKLIVVAIYLFCFTLSPTSTTYADSKYQHDRFVTNPTDIVRQSEAYMVSFDSADDNDGDGRGDTWRIPEFVAYEIKKYDGKCIPTGERPKWFCEPELVTQGVAPTDSCYAYSSTWRKTHEDWYERGHLCMKLIAERISNEAGYNTHNLLNAVPQREVFNGGIWLDLELLSAAYAQRYEKVWVVTGPIFYDKTPNVWIGEKSKGEVAVAVPDALFKIIVKESKDATRPDVLAFIYNQQGTGYGKGPFNHASHLVSVDEIEKLTGLDFLTSLPDESEAKVEKIKVKALWPVSKSDFISACKK